MATNKSCVRCTHFWQEKCTNYLDGTDPVTGEAIYPDAAAERKSTGRCKPAGLAFNAKTNPPPQPHEPAAPSRRDPSVRTIGRK